MSHLGYASAAQFTSRYVLLGNSSMPSSISFAGSELTGHSSRNINARQVFVKRQRLGYYPLKVVFFGIFREYLMGGGLSFSGQSKNCVKERIDE